MELKLRAMQGGGKNFKGPGLSDAADFLKGLFTLAPGTGGDAFVTESGRIGRIIRKRMCGDTRGMTPCYDIEWLEQD